MLKKIVAMAALLASGLAFAAVDANRATPAELDGVKGIGPATSKLINDERTKAPFKDWDDFTARVRGIGDSRAAKLSAEGLTINGASFKGPTAEKTRDPARPGKDKPAAR